MTSKTWIHDRQRDLASRRSAVAARRWRPAGLALAALLIALLAPSAAMAQITEGNSRTAANANGGESTLNVPAPTAAPGDLLLAQVTYEKGSETIRLAPGPRVEPRADDFIRDGRRPGRLLEEAAAGDPLTYGWNFKKGS